MITKKDGNRRDPFQELRDRAKALLEERPTPFQRAEVDPLNVLELIDELADHRAELQIQNEELRRARTELADLHAEYVDLYYEFAPCGYATLNPAGRIERINLRGASLLGIDRENAGEMPFWALVHAKSEDDYYKITRRIDETKKRQSAELRLLPKRGASVWVRADIVPDLDEHGNIYRYRMTLVDISERKETEHALLESDRRHRELAASLEIERGRLKAIIDSLPVGLWVADATGKMVLINDSARAIWGGEAPVAESVEDYECYKAWWADTGKPILVENFPMVRSLRGEMFKNVAVIFERFDGGKGSQLVSSAPVRTSDGTVIGSVSVGQDISEVKRTERELLRQRELLKSIFDNIPVLLVKWNPDLRSFKLNRHAETVFGWTTEEANEGDFMGKVFPDKAYRTEVADYMLNLEPGWHEWIATTKGGELVPLDWANIRLEDGTVVGIGVDMRERKKAEESLRRSNETAEARADQLRALTVRLLEAEEHERRRISELLHDDLQQILAAARMQLRAVCANASAAPELEEVEQLLAESIRKSRELSHELNPMVLCQFGLVAALESLATNTFRNFGLQVELDASDERRFASEPLNSFLYRAVRELLFNAVKHAEATIARIKLFGSEGKISVTVSDNGRGCRMDVLEISNASTGLGLAGIRERARSLGGELKIESSSEQGTRFTLTMPIISANDGDQKKRRALIDAALPVSRRSEDSRGYGPIRVLFVDDHQIIREGLIKLIAGQPDIESAGEASNGQEAVEQALLLKPDLILMDFAMPEMDGLEATRLVKENLPATRVIGLSMFKDEIVSRMIKEAGADAYLTKTASTAELVETIYSVVQTKPAFAEDIGQEKEAPTLEQGPERIAVSNLKKN